MVVGTCSLCGGAVTTPDVWMSVLPAPKTCSSCGAVAAEHGPIIQMRRTEPAEWPPHPAQWRPSSMSGLSTADRIPQMFCEHANECPTSLCRCPVNCACRDGMCKGE